MEFSDEELLNTNAIAEEGYFTQPQVPPPLAMPFGVSLDSPQSTLEMINHPPSEVRTRTPGDKRTFSASVQLVGNWRGAVSTVVVALLFSPDRVHTRGFEEAPAKLLGGTLSMVPNNDGVCTFSQLWLWEPSAKHDEREFVLSFTPVDANGRNLSQPLLSNSFYAFSHARVLKRRRDVYLRALNKTSGCNMNGGDRMFVVGRGFIDSPSLSVVIQVAGGGETRANQLEFWSECVLFFTLPPIPLGMQLNGDADSVSATLFVSNDGRSRSNPLEFEYCETAAGQQQSDNMIPMMMRARF
jgi:hypothetical protein